MHRSWCAENAGHPSNERLEFLGDAVLGVIVTDHVYRVYPDLDEGALTEIRKTVVNSVALAEVAEGLGVGEHLLLGKGEELSGGREKPSILADAMEAIIGATYLAEGMEAATQLVLLGARAPSSPPRPPTAPTTRAASRSCRPTCSACLLATRWRPPVPTTPRTFFVTATVDGVAYGKGEGRSKKQAEQAAARHAVEALVEHTPDELRETHHG